MRGISLSGLVLLLLTLLLVLLALDEAEVLHV